MGSESLWWVILRWLLRKTSVRPFNGKWLFQCIFKNSEFYTQNHRPLHFHFVLAAKFQRFRVRLFQIFLTSDWSIQYSV
jgi:hypothetical protein